MTPITTTTSPITESGEYSLPAIPAGRPVLFSISGTFSGASVTPGYADPAGNFVAYKDADGVAFLATSPRGWRAYLPYPGTPAVSITNVSAQTSIIITCTPSA